MKNLLILFVTIITIFGCKPSIHKPADGKSTPLVLREGLLYADSTANIPFTGRNKSRMMDMKIEYDVVNGIKEGDFITYYSNDKIQMIGKMKGNKNVGEWKYYFQDGSLETTGFYDNDIPTGKWTWYYPNGKVVEEGNYLNGKREGEWKNYDSTGLLDIIRVYKENKMIDSVKN